METLVFALAFAAALASGLMAGFFYAFSGLVMPAFAQRPAHEAAEAMRAINVVVLNPLFFSLFFGAGVAGLAAALLALFGDGEVDAAWALAATLVYLAGSIGVTIARNVPLNEELARTAPGAAEIGPLWARYLVDWTWWNHVRTIACLLASAGYILAIA